MCCQRFQICTDRAESFPALVVPAGLLYALELKMLLRIGACLKPSATAGEHAHEGIHDPACSQGLTGFVSLLVGCSTCSFARRHSVRNLT